MTGGALLSGAMVGVFLLGTASSVGVAQTRRGWDHAYLYRIWQSVAIAYVEEDRCRIEELTAPDTARFDFMAPPNSRVSSAATAMTMLSDEGWEMVGEGMAYCHSPTNQGHASAIHFKRPR